MPILKNSSYRRPFYLPGNHLETIMPALFMKVKPVNYLRQRLELVDGDFLDLDWLKGGNKKCLVISHGLEGSSDRYSVRRSAHYFFDRGYDILAWNCRSCSGEMNRLPRFYHHGETQDLALVINEVLAQPAYQELYLFGHSMGGSLVLKYLGERKPDSRIRGSASFSVPCSLEDSADQLAKKSNRFYHNRFLNKLKEKIRIKATIHNEISASDLDSVRDFETFHKRYTLPLHGFKSIDDFYRSATCDQFFGTLNTPSLIVNAQNDPILGPRCYPRTAARQNPDMILEIPKHGGHSGFLLPFRSGYSWAEVRADQFFNGLSG